MECDSLLSHQSAVTCRSTRPITLRIEIHGGTVGVDTQRVTTSDISEFITTTIQCMRAASMLGRIFVGKRHLLISFVEVNHKYDN
jgi:hypothetical protein